MNEIIIEYRKVDVNTINPIPILNPMMVMITSITFWSFVIIKREVAHRKTKQ